MQDSSICYQLSSDIIFEILSRSSLSTLGKCRQLSKECNTLTYESSFMNQHCQRSKILSGYFLQDLKYCKYSSTFVSAENSASNCNLSLDFLPLSDVKIEASTSQGVLLCVDETARIPRFYVCKPSTKEWQVIPNPKTRYFTQRMAMIVLKSNPLHYKIVRFSQPKSCKSKEYYCYRLRCEVFDKISMEWRVLPEVNLQDGEFLGWEPHVSVCGSLHWLTSKSNIFAFHEDKDNYSIFSLPSLVFTTAKNRYEYHLALTNYEGKLGLICMRRSKSFMNLWVMENYEQKEWSLRQTISIEYVRRVEPYTRCVSMYNADIALMTGFYRALLHKFKNGNIDIFDLKMDIRHEGIFPFQSDFEPCNLNNEYMKKRSRGKSRRSNESNLKNIVPRFCQNLYFNLSPAFVFLVLLFVFTFFCFSFDL